MEQPSVPKKRGNYRKYLRDSSSPIPKTSHWRLKKLDRRDAGSSTSAAVMSNLSTTHLVNSTEHPVTTTDASNESSSDCLGSPDLTAEPLGDTDSAFEVEESYDTQHGSDCSDEQRDSDDCALAGEGLSNEEVLIEDNYWDPVYENASISTVGA